MPNRVRSKQLNFRLSEDEFNKVQKLITQSKLNQSEYIRKSVLDKKIIVVDDIQELVKELKRIGNNLNQLTRVANSHGAIGTDELKSIQNELDKVWSETISALKKVNQ